MIDGSDGSGDLTPNAEAVPEPPRKRRRRGERVLQLVGPITCFCLVIGGLEYAGGNLQAYRQQGDIFSFLKDERFVVGFVLGHYELCAGNTMSGLNDGHKEIRRAAKGQGRPLGWIDWVADEVVKFDDELFSLPFDAGKNAYQTLGHYDHHNVQTLKGDSFEGSRSVAEWFTNIVLAKYPDIKVVYATLSYPLYRFMLLNYFLVFAATPVARRRGPGRKFLFGDRPAKWEMKAFQLQVSKFADRAQGDGNAYGHDRVWAAAKIVKYVRASLNLKSLRDIHKSKVNFAAILEDEGVLTEACLEWVRKSKSCNYETLRRARPKLDMTMMTAFRQCFSKTRPRTGISALVGRRFAAEKGHGIIRSFVRSVQRERRWWYGFFTSPHATNMYRNWITISIWQSHESPLDYLAYGGPNVQRNEALHQSGVQF